MQYIFKQIIIHNIIKANAIQTETFTKTTNDITSVFREIKLTQILENQNKFSRDAVTGIIYILNTCIFLVPDYNLNLIK
ncbi:hypothetical protein D3C76_1669630 [compost metagenome]